MATTVNGKTPNSSERKDDTTKTPGRSLHSAKKLPPDGIAPKYDANHAPTTVRADDISTSGHYIASSSASFAWHYLGVCSRVIAILDKDDRLSTNAKLEIGGKAISDIYGFDGRIKMLEILVREEVEKYIASQSKV